MLTNRRARHLHPWFDSLHLIVDSPDDGRYVATTLVGCVTKTIGRTGPAIGVSDVIKVDSIDIIIPYNLPTDACQIGSHRRVGGVEIRPCGEATYAEALFISVLHPSELFAPTGIVAIQA